MKSCSECGNSFLGQGKLCDVCRRRARHSSRSGIPTPKKTPEQTVVSSLGRGTPVELPPLAREQEVYLSNLAVDAAAPVDMTVVIGGPDKAVAGQPCPTCGRPMPLTNKERQRRYREKRK